MPVSRTRARSDVRHRFVIDASTPDQEQADRGASDDFGYAGGGNRPCANKEATHPWHT